MDFYKRLNYSLGNEDWTVEEQALKVAPGDHIVCVTASGDRPLHLLMTDCASIISIDMNPIQNYLLNLKRTAINHLDYEKYLGFLGCEDTSHRYAIFNEIKPHMDPDAAEFWSQHKKMIENGVIYQGLVERLTNYAAKFFKLVRNKKIHKLFSFTEIDSQREYLSKEWDTFVWREFIEIFINSNVLKFIINDPGLNSYIDTSIHPGKYIYERMQGYLNHSLAKKSPLLQLIFTGKVLPDAYFPYLTFDGYTKIRESKASLNYLTDNIIEYLEAHNSNGIDCFSLSDIASYMPQEIFEKLLRAILNAAKSGARFCMREFMTKRTIPDELTQKFVRNSELEQKLEYEESNFVYRFLAGEIQK